ncbi:MAG: FtsL-like putative cell division protein [Bacteroidales bacterium]
MSKNKVKNEHKKKQSSKKDSGKRRQRLLNSAVGHYLQSLLDGSVFTSEKYRVSMPYVFLLTMLALIYIGNNYHAQQKVRALNRLERETKELRFEYRSINSRLMYESKQSEVAEKLKDSGIEESKTPPKKIIANKHTQE